MSESRIHVGDLKPGDIALIKQVAQEAAEKAAERGAERVAEETVRRTLTVLGIDVTDPISAQRDFAFLRDQVSRSRDEDLIADAAFLRATRQRCEGTTAKIMAPAFATLLGVLFLGAMTSLWHGIKAWAGLPP